MILQPSHILIARAVDLIIDLPVRHEWRSSASVAPLFNFGMAIGQGKATGEIMVHAGQIVETILVGLTGVPFHTGCKVADIDTVFTHIEKDEQLSRAGILKVGLLEIELGPPTID